MKLLDYSGLQRFLSKIKTLLDSKSNTGHTHVTSEVTDLLNSQHTWSAQQSYSADLNLNYASTDVDDILDTVAGSYTAEDFLAQNNVWTGDNTFKGIYQNQGDTNYIIPRGTNTVKGDLTTSGFFSLIFKDKNNGNLATSGIGYLNLGQNSSGSSATIGVETIGSTDNTRHSNSISLKIDPTTNDNTAQFYPVNNNATDLGTSTNQWNNLYARKTYTSLIKAATGDLIIQSNGTDKSVAIHNGTLVGDGGGIWLYGKDHANGSKVRLQIYNTTTSGFEGVDLSNSSLYPAPNNLLNLGTSTNQWKSVYAQSYYYNGTEFQNKFVTLDTNQTITGEKTFSDGVFATGSKWSTTTNTTDDITYLGATFYIQQRTSGTLTDLSNGAWNVIQLGSLGLFVRNNNYGDIRYKHFYSNTLGRIHTLDSSGHEIINLVPAVTNTYDLGTSTNQWNSLYAKNYYYNGTAWGLDKYNIWTSCQKMVGNPTIWDMKNNSITMGGTQPTSNRYLGFIFYDSADTEMGRMCLQCHKNGYNYYVFAINNSDGTNSYNGSVRMAASRAGTFTLYPDAGTWNLGDTGTQWANIYGTTIYENGTALSSKYLSLTGGTLTGQFNRKNTGVTKGTNPSSTTYWEIYNCDKNGTAYKANCLGLFGTSLTSAGVVSTYIRAIKNTANVDTNCSLGCTYDTANNTSYTFAPTPPTADDSTKIATTMFVRNAIPYVLSGGASTSAGKITPVEGTIILGGTAYTSATAPTGTGIVVAGNKLSYAKVCWDGQSSKFVFTYGDNVGSGSWKLMGASPTPSGTWSSCAIFGLWIRIAN